MLCDIVVCERERERGGWREREREREKKRERERERERESKRNFMTTIILIIILFNPEIQYVCVRVSIYRCPIYPSQQQIACTYNQL